MRGMTFSSYSYDRPTYRLDDAAIERLAADLLAGDGSWHLGPYDEMLGEVADWEYGYTVGGYRKKTLIGVEDLGEVVAFLKPLLRTDTYLSNGTTIGSWRDEDGVLYLDLGSRYLSLSKAVIAAQDRGEKAVWDWAEQGCHYLTENGGLRWGTV